MTTSLRRMTKDKLIDLIADLQADLRRMECRAIEAEAQLRSATPPTVVGRASLYAHCKLLNMSGTKCFVQGNTIYDSSTRRPIALEH